MKVIITGANGFIGKNLSFILNENEKHEVMEVTRDTSKKVFLSYLKEADFIYHLAGVNRPKNESEFKESNVDLTNFITSTLKEYGRKVPIAISSSSQVHLDNIYGASKLEAEDLISTYSKITGATNYILRLPNVFGKWCKPNYNSFVATFCYNIVNGIDISINDSNSKVSLVYIDDVCKLLVSLLDGEHKGGLIDVPNVYKTTVGEVAEIIYSFKSSRKTLISEQVGAGLKRALYSTYLSYITPKHFSYDLISHEDNRGVFCEMLKTKDSGQFSFFTAHPGITRGGHYHHTKTEKFLVVKGKAKFCFNNILTNEKYSITTTADKPQMVETIPGWSHDITNISDEELIVMLWANEIFDPENPDTMEASL